MSKYSNGDPASGYTRRDFIKATMAAGLLASPAPSWLSSVAMAAEEPSREVLTGSHWGVFRASVTNGRAVAIKAWEKDPRPSAQLPGVLDSIYSPTRIRYPMVRRAYLEQGPGADPAGRGEGDFVRVGWDQALDLVARELQRVRQAHGPSGIYAGSYGWRSPGKLHNCLTLLHRFMNLTGGYVGYSGDYSAGAALVILPYVVGSIEVYEQCTAWPVVAEHTQLMVFWGCDPMNNSQIGHVVPDHGAYPGIEGLKARGIKTLCIDPAKTQTCEYLGAEWIAPRPQTDVAMMLGIAHTLYAEKLHDQAFLDRYTTGFDKFLPYLLGQQDGTPKTADWAAGICGIPADTLRDLARRFSRQRTMLALGYSTQRQHHGEQVHWMLITLASMLGQIGLPGGGYGLSYHYASGGSPTADSPSVPSIGDAADRLPADAWKGKQAMRSIPVSRISEMLLNPGKTYDFNGTKGIYPDIKLIYWAGGNPFSHQQDRNELVRAWRKPETIIVQDFQWTASARHADIVLPATTSYERNDIEQVGDFGLNHILAMHKVVEPVFEARSDFDIFSALAQRLGQGDAFTEQKSEMDWLRAFYEAARIGARAKGLEMPIFDSFWNSAQPLAFPLGKGKDFVSRQDFRADPLLNALGTPSGRIEIYSATIEKMGYDDCPPHPTWMEPFERLDGPTAKYPLHVDTVHPRYRLHSQLCGTVLREKYAIAGREPCLMHPEDAARRGLKDGDVVRVFNDRGQMLAGLAITDAIRPGVVRINEGGWYDPVDPRTPGSLCRYGDVNTLTSGISTSRLAQANCGHSVLAQVEKFEGPIPAVQVFESPRTH
ncbi:trimethylamine-N-oxide reductase TorA [Achromobacter aloeverae]